MQCIFSGLLIDLQTHDFPMFCRCWCVSSCFPIAGLLGLIAIAGCASAPAPAAVSAGPAVPGVVGAPPYTLWTFLGFDPIFAKLGAKCDHLHAKMALLNPAFGPQVPLKPLTDPSLAQSPNVAVASASSVVAKKAEIPQTKAALAAVAEIGCACDPATVTALRAGLDSCFPEVRLAAAEAIRKSVRLSQDGCDHHRCCAPVLSEKLYQMGWGCDEQGCYLEADGNVRLAARQAYRACGCPCFPLDTEPAISKERPQRDVLKATQADQ